jgi:hypothetical protein
MYIPFARCRPSIVPACDGGTDAVRTRCASGSGGDGGSEAAGSS